MIDFRWLIYPLRAARVLLSTRHMHIQPLYGRIRLLCTVAFLALTTFMATSCAIPQRGLLHSEASSRRRLEPTWYRIGSFSTTFDITEVGKLVAQMTFPCRLLVAITFWT